MKKTQHSGVLDLIAKNNGYRDKIELLCDYRFIPTVMMPKHRKIEIIPLLMTYIKQKH